MITKSKNKGVKGKKGKEAERKAAAQRKKVLQDRYGIGKPPKHYGANR